MADVLFVYDTKYGQTQRIAEYAAALARNGGHVAQVLRAGAVSALASADAVVVLSPIFMGKHMKSIRRFVVQNRDVLSKRPTAFVTVSGSAASQNASDRAQAEKIARDFLADAGWRPSLVASVAGAIAFPRYNPIVRFFMKRIVRKEGGSTDTSRIHELTDWGAVKQTILDLLAAVETKHEPDTPRLRTVA